MSRVICLFQSSTRLGRGVLWAILTCATAAWSQQPAGYTYNHKSAIDQAHSRAEQQAEQLVSLSSDKIITLLREEPGLLLQVKKALVRKAFEQGQVIDPANLTDDKVFGLLVQDENTRVIATREIEDRYYIRAKPTREELVRSLPCRESSGQPAVQTISKDQASNSQSEEVKPMISQEQIYWQKHEVDLDCYSLQTAPYDVLQALYDQLVGQPTAEQLQQQPPVQQYPQQPYPQQQYPQSQSPQQPYPPSQVAPQNQPAPPLRQLQLTGLQFPAGNYF